MQPILGGRNHLWRHRTAGFRVGSQALVPRASVGARQHQLTGLAMPSLGIFAAIIAANGRILVVRQNYGGCLWTTPGGRGEPGEWLLDALRREVREETGFEIEIGDLAGIYHKCARDDLVVSLYARISGGVPAVPNGEIAQMNWFDANTLPEPMAANSRLRILDALSGLHGVVRVVEPE
ncbi:MAG: NUDIX domain-containing protein [Methylococcaceae bacterium]|nr:NUDIX domain-containing protein [Methylococcaceae bacterium]